ncbi:MAG: 6-phosphogluconolactonase [Vicinamibacterales bacterium]
MAVLTICDNAGELAERAAAQVVALASEAVRARGVAMICLAGGTTPSRTYELLASERWRGRIVWERVHLYWSDERHVPPDHKDSNYGMARDALVMHVPIPAAHVHRIRGELPPDEAARLYERELPARLELLLLGLGEDAHLASIFPGSPLVRERRRRVAPVWVPHLKAYRITLTPPAILAADRILMLAAGAMKASAVAAAIDRPTDPDGCPAHLLREAGARVEWLIDRDAARDLSSRRV